jgi:hypothetical protein
MRFAVLPGMTIKNAVKYSLDDCGCYVDGARGIYALRSICEFATSHGATVSAWDAEFAHEAEDECDNYMNEHYGVEGACWGRSEAGDWGLWEVEAD